VATPKKLLYVATLLAANPEFLLTSSEAATYLRLSPGTLAVWRSHGRGPKFLLVATQVRYLKVDLDAFVASCQTQRKVSPDVGRPVQKRRGRR